MRDRLWRLLVVGTVTALVAVGCSGGDDTTGEAGGSTTSEGPAEPDPTEVDRSSRFAGLESFCEPPEDDAEEPAPEATDEGITEDAIHITHIRTQLEQLADIGFGVDIGDPNDTAATFVDLVNERCGGIHGRRIELSTVEVPALPPEGQDTSSLAQAACIEAAEDNNAVIAYSTSGFGDVGVPCLTQNHDVIFLTSYTVSLDDMDQAGGRLYATGLAGEESLTYMARDLAARGELDGKTIGVVRSDATPDAQIVERGLVEVLRDELGLNVARVDTIGCGGSNSCGEGVIPSVQGMIADGVDAIFPTLNLLSLPGYIAELDKQGVRPGDIEFFQSGYVAQSGDLVSGKVSEFGGDAAGKLYNGATIIASAPTGDFRLPDYEQSEFGAMCSREYAENGEAGEEYNPTDETSATRYGAMVGMCSAIRVFARAIEAAGPNPTRDDLVDAMEGLGAIDQGADPPGSFGPGKYTAPNGLYTMHFQYPCQYETSYKSNACVVVDGEAREQPREPVER